jgi:hypothetical protein
MTTRSSGSPGTTRKHNHSGRNYLVNGTGKALVAITGLGLVAAFAIGGSASADPTGTPTARVLVGSGSDTTQDAMNGLSNVITASGSNYRATGLLYATTPAGATSIQTSLLPASGDVLTLEASNQSGTVQAGTPTTTSFVVNFVPNVGDVLTLGANSGTVASVVIGANATTSTVTLAAALPAAPAVGDAVIGHQQEQVTVASVTPAVASTGVGNVATPYNTVTLTSATTKVHAKNSTVMGAFLAAGTKVISSFDAQGGAYSTKANPNCQYIANNGPGGGTFTGTTQNGVAYNGTILNSTSGVVGARGNGSGRGAGNVNDALNTANGVWGCTDFARASGSQGLSNAGANGAINIPFALDGVTFAVTTTSNYPRKLTFQNLLDIYSCNYPGMIPASTTAAQILASHTTNGVQDGTPQTYAAANGYTYAALPQAGSGTRGFVIAMLGNLATIPVCVANGVTPTGAVLEEHNLTTLDDNGIAPVSIAQSITQREQALTGISDKQGRTVLVALDNSAAVTGLPSGASNGVLNYPVTMTPSFGGAASSNTIGRFWRDVYNIVPVQRLQDPNIQAAFVGPTSGACSNNATLALYGFAPNPNCGSVTLKVQ